MLDLFCELARLPSPSGEERAVADVVLGYLADCGLEAQEDESGPVIGRARRAVEITKKNRRIELSPTFMFVMPGHSSLPFADYVNLSALPGIHVLNL